MSICGALIYLLLKKPSSLFLSQTPEVFLHVGFSQEGFWLMMSGILTWRVRFTPQASLRVTSSWRNCWMNLQEDFLLSAAKTFVSHTNRIKLRSGRRGWRISRTSHFMLAFFSADSDRLQPEHHLSLTLGSTYSAFTVLFCLSCRWTGPRWCAAV